MKEMKQEQKFKKGDKIKFQKDNRSYCTIVEVYENGYVAQEIGTNKMGVITNLEAMWWFELVEEKNKEESFVADLRELGCQVEFIFYETPTGPEPDYHGLLLINDWLKDKKDVSIVCMCNMLSTDNNLYYMIQKKGRYVYQSSKKWSMGQGKEVLYDGIKQTIRLLKFYTEE